MRMRRYFWWGMHFGRFGVFGSLLFIVLLGAFIGLIVWGFTRLASEHHSIPMGPGGGMPGGGMPGAVWGPPGDDALHTARLRYARGELTREQYFQVVGDLTAVRFPAPGVPPTAERPVDPATPGA